MAKKLGLGAASQRVLTIAAGFDDLLLEVENRAVQDIADQLAARVDEARRQVEAGLRRSRDDTKRFRSIAAVRREVVRLHSAALKGCIPVITELAGQSIDRSLVSVKAELEVCAQTMHPRYAKLPEVAARLALTTRDEILGNASAAASAAVSQTARKFQPDYTQQTFAAKEGPELIDRLFSFEQVAARGFNRRGVWWSASSDLGSAARLIATECANLVRGSAIYSFNKVGKAHG